jgi:hypothetical protein
VLPVAAWRELGGLGPVADPGRNVPAEIKGNVAAGSSGGTGLVYVGVVDGAGCARRRCCRGGGVVRARECAGAGARRVRLDLAPDPPDGGRADLCEFDGDADSAR